MDVLAQLCSLRVELCVPLCRLQLSLTTGCLKGCGEWQERGKRKKPKTEEHRQGRHRRAKRWKERAKPRAGTVDLGYVHAIGWTPVCRVCFCSIFTVQSDTGHWWMAPYVSCISSHRNHSGCLAQVGVLGDVMRSIKEGRRGLERNMCCLENSLSCLVCLA